MPDSCTKVEVLGVWQCNTIIQTGPKPTPVALVTKILAYCHILASVVQGRATITLGIATHSSFCLILA